MGKRVLFVCNLNSVRSPMAAALASASAADVASAGLEPGEADPFAAAVLAEEGLDISGHVPEALNADALSGFDRIICLTPEAHDMVLDLLKRAGQMKRIPVEFWPTLDPFVGGQSENRQQRLAAYRSLRDQLRGLIRERL